MKKIQIRNNLLDILKQNYNNTGVIKNGVFEVIPSLYEFINNNTNIDNESKLYIKDKLSSLLFHLQNYNNIKNLTLVEYQNELIEYNSKYNKINNEFIDRINDLNLISLYWRYNYSYNDACLNINASKRTSKND